MVDTLQMQHAFLASHRHHVLMITNHGIHQWQVIPGLPDTGGQNVFVNQFTESLAQAGFKITIVNRGGYPHPATGALHRGLVYKDEHQRILYLEDGREEFVRKEDMHEQIPDLVQALDRLLEAEGSDIDLILSHYWDAAQIGVLYNRRRPRPVKHVWIPHSLGSVKKRNVAAARWAGLRIDERIAVEQELTPELDGVAATSSTIRQALADDYDYRGPDLFLPPCVDPDRYHPRPISEDDAIWAFLAEWCGREPEQVRGSLIVTEISRTDTTKRKNVLIEAFARVRRRVPDSLLVISIDENERELAQELKTLIRTWGIESHTAVVGSIWEILPVLYAVTDVYCTPSVMEGFGMSPQEAAASGVPVVASHLVPFVVEYLLGPEPRGIWPGSEGIHPVQEGSGAMVVQADDVHGFAFALERLLADGDLRARMGEAAYRVTIPYFTWQHMTGTFLAGIGMAPESGEDRA